MIYIIILIKLSFIFLKKFIENNASKQCAGSFLLVIIIKINNNNFQEEIHAYFINIFYIWYRQVYV